MALPPFLTPKDRVTTDQGGPGAGLQIYINNEVFSKIAEAALDSPNEEIGGVLIGRVYGNDLDVADILVARRLPGQPGAFTFAPEHWDYFHKELARRPGTVMVGWYHSHLGIGLFLSPDDRFINSGFFRERHHIAIVYDLKQGWGIWKWAGRAEMDRCGFYVYEWGAAAPAAEEKIAVTEEETKKAAVAKLEAAASKFLITYLAQFDALPPEEQYSPKKIKFFYMGIKKPVTDAQAELISQAPQLRELHRSMVQRMKEFVEAQQAGKPQIVLSMIAKNIDTTFTTMRFLLSQVEAQMKLQQELAKKAEAARTVIEEGALAVKPKVQPPSEDGIEKRRAAVKEFGPWFLLRLAEATGLTEECYGPTPSLAPSFDVVTLEERKEGTAAAWYDSKTNRIKISIFDVKAISHETMHFFRALATDFREEITGYDSLSALLRQALAKKAEHAVKFVDSTTTEFFGTIGEAIAFDMIKGTPFERFCKPFKKITLTELKDRLEYIVEFPNLLRKLVEKFKSGADITNDIRDVDEKIMLLNREFLFFYNEDPEKRFIKLYTDFKKTFEGLDRSKAWILELQLNPLEDIFVYFAKEFSPTNEDLDLLKNRPEDVDFTKGTVSLGTVQTIMAYFVPMIVVSENLDFIRANLKGIIRIPAEEVTQKFGFAKIRSDIVEIAKEIFRKKKEISVALAKMAAEAAKAEAAEEEITVRELTPLERTLSELEERIPAGATPKIRAMLSSLLAEIKKMPDETPEQRENKLLELKRFLEKYGQYLK